MSPTSLPSGLARRVLRYLLLVTLIGTAYFVAGTLGLKLAFVHMSASAVWPPTGIALAAFLLFGWRVWPAVFAGALLVNETTSATLATSMAIAFGNTLEGLVGALLVRRYGRGSHAFEQAKDIVVFTLLAGLVATLISPSVGVAALWGGGFAEAPELAPIWFTWWLGDFSGAVVVTPLILLVAAKPSFWRWKAARALETFALVAFLILVGEAVFGPSLPFGRGKDPLIFLFLPLLIWPAYRLGSGETALASVLMAGFAIYGTLQGRGPFVQATPNQSLLLLQSFVAVVSITALVLAAAVRQQKRLEHDEKVLSELTAVLGPLTDPDRVLVRMAQFCAPRIADWCVVYAVDRQDRLRCLTVAHADAAQAKRAEEFLVRHGAPELPGCSVEQVFRTRQPVAGCPLRPAAPEGERGAALRDFTRLTRATSIYCAPINLRNATVGTVAFLSADRQPPLTPERIALLQEVTRRTAIAVENAQLYLEAQRAVASREEFLSIASHELRTPLTSLLLEIEALLRFGSRGPSQILEPARSAMVHGQRLAAMIAELLDITRIRLGKLDLSRARCDLAELVRSVASRFSTDARMKGIAVTVRAAPGVVGRWDSLRLEQVVTNLLSNAFKYGEGRPVAVTVEAAGACARLSVQDHGLGMTPEDRARIFLPFERGERARHHGGWGLGLYIVQRIVQAHGGRILVESQVGVGSTFTVELPRECPAAAAAA